METKPMRDGWIRELEKFLRAHRHGYYTALEASAKVIDLMPEGGAADLVARLPDDIVQSLRRRVAESATWTEEEWESLTNIWRPNPTPDENREYRRKLGELRACFDN
jgi:hypothetical protein